MEIAGVNIVDYPEAKESGRVAIAKVGIHKIMAVKRFDPLTGDELAPAMTRLTKAELLAKKASLEAEITAIDLMIADVDALDK